MQALQCANCYKFFTFISPEQIGEEFRYQCKECGTMNDLAIIRIDSNGTYIFRVVGTLAPDA
jgi:hypothetical protein